MDKICIVCGTRPELIRLSIIINKLKDIYKENFIFIYTNQNFTDSLSSIFFEELQITNPNYLLTYDKDKCTFIDQLSNISLQLDQIFEKEKIKKLLVLGDTNSVLISTLVAMKKNIKIYHLEAGNRVFNKQSPEENNRKIIDHTADINLCYTQLAKENLLNEGIKINSIYIIGNPIVEVIKQYEYINSNNNILNKLNIEENNYFLVTLHRSETVDNLGKLYDIILALNEISIIYNKKVIISTHPRTKNKLENLNKEKVYDHNSEIFTNKKFNINNYKNLVFSDPFSFLDFIKLEEECYCLLSDSGTVQEEAAIFKKPCIILRDYTERTETLELGNTILSGVNYNDIIDSVKIILSYNYNNINDIYLNSNNVSNKVINIISGV
jgi:UDP-N-acetylglucosamine 2-epimerase (non-hydrolysing)